ncbi:MAG: hypothetical protein IID33_11015, partial [Planctomycetes bacterium]|nr:hypothetical protein [Planctomycetota bacterium]
MKPPIMVGTVIAIVITAGAVFAPALRSSASKNAAQAAADAEFARRLLSDAGARVANALMASELAALT